MAGIAPQPQAPQASQDNPDQATQQGPDEVGDEEGLQPNVSPDEQKAYEEFVLAGEMLIYQPKTANGPPHVRPEILKLLDGDHSDLKAILKVPELQQDNSPLVAIAATTVIIVLQLIKEAGAIDRPSDDVIVHGGVAILEDLAEVWMRATGQQLGEDQVHRALSMAADLYREVATDMGLVDTGALKQQFAELVQADKSGNLASISPDLAGINQAAQINAQDGADVPSPDQQGGDQSAAPPQEPQ